MANLETLIRKNFLEYASYSILDRAIPELRDGCKPVQRRILHTLSQMHDGHFHKVANVVGESMKLHPHGDTAITDALTVLANKEYFIERQGNFGNPLTGHPAAAPRYIECKLTDLAVETLFNKHLTEMTPSYDGRRDEPVVLPAKLPVALLIGVEGIAVGMSTRILPHNFGELLRAQVAILKKKRFKLVPDFRTGGEMDVAEYAQGLGKVKVRARIDPVGDKKVVIREIAFGTTTESVISSIESAVQKGRVKISGINDFTTDKVEIEISLQRGVYADEVIPQLYAYTDCEVSHSSIPVVVHERHPEELTVPKILEFLTEQLRQTLKAELNWHLGQLEDRRHWLTLEQIFIEKKVYKKIETAKTADKVRENVRKGMMAFKRQFARALVDDDVRRLLEIPIRRISAYDIEKHRTELGEVAADIKTTEAKLKRLTPTTIKYLEDLIRRYADQFPRRTRIGKFEEVDKKAVAAQSIKLSYDPETSFFGSQVRSKEFQMTVSEYDRVLAISSDGSYRIMSPPKKVLLPRSVVYCALFDPEEGAEFTVVYRDNKRMAYAKRIKIEKFINNKEYRLIKDDKGKLDVLVPAGDPLGRAHLRFTAMKRQRIKEARFDLADLQPTGVTARGTRLAGKPVSRIKHES